METALGALEMRPADFWAMTTFEFQAKVDGTNAVRRTGPEPMDRDRLAELMAQYPD